MPHTPLLALASALATSRKLPVVPPGALHLLRLRLHKYGLLLLAWEDAQVAWASLGRSAVCL